MAAEKFVLHMKSHSKQVCSVLRELYDTSSLTDVTLLCEGQNFNAHKVVLSSCSPYFRNLFETLSVKHPVVYMKGVKKLLMKDMLDFIYNGEVTVAHSDLTLFLEIANDLSIHGLHSAQGEKDATEDSNKDTTNEFSSPVSKKRKYTPTSTNSSAKSPLWMEKNKDVQSERFLVSSHFTDRRLESDEITLEGSDEISDFSIDFTPGNSQSKNLNETQPRSELRVKKEVELDESSLDSGDTSVFSSAGPEETYLGQGNTQDCQVEESSHVENTPLQAGDSILDKPFFSFIKPARQTYTVEEKLKVLKKLDQLGGNVSATAKECQVPRTCIQLWKKQDLSDARQVDTYPVTEKRVGCANNSQGKAATNDAFPNIDTLRKLLEPEVIIVKGEWEEGFDATGSSAAEVGGKMSELKGPVKMGREVCTMKVQPDAKTVGPQHSKLVFYGSGCSAKESKEGPSMKRPRTEIQKSQAEDKTPKGSMETQLPVLNKNFSSISLNLSRPLPELHIGSKRFVVVQDASGKLKAVPQDKLLYCRVPANRVQYQNHLVDTKLQAALSSQQLKNTGTMKMCFVPEMLRNQSSRVSNEGIVVNKELGKGEQHSIRLENTSNTSAHVVMVQKSAAVYGKRNGSSVQTQNSQCNIGSQQLFKFHTDPRTGKRCVSVPKNILPSVLLTRLDATKLTSSQNVSLKVEKHQ